MAVNLYFLAARDVRVGMDAVLIGTLSPHDAWAVIDGYSSLFNNAHEKQRCFELMTILDQVATKQRGSSEEQKRAAAYEAAEKNRSGRGR